MASLRRKYKARGFLAYFQAFTNTYAPLDRLRALYDEAISVEGVLGLCIGTRPDCVNDKILDLIASYRDRFMVWVEYGLQSANDETLKRINRGHDFSTFRKAVEETHRRGILVCAHVIIGLPGEGPEDIHLTASRIAPLPIDGVKIHSLYVLKGTKLEEMVLKGLYSPWSQGDYVDAVCDFLERIPARWVVQRLTGDPPLSAELLAPSWALQKTETIQMISRRLQQRDTWQGRLLGDTFEALLWP